MILNFDESTAKLIHYIVGTVLILEFCYYF